MPVSGGKYIQRDKDDILTFLQAEMRAEYGEDIDFTQSSAFSTFAQAISEVDSDELEPAIQTVHDAAYVDAATDEHLENLVAILGIERRSAVHATGVIEFQSDSTVKQNHDIANGTTVQTDSEQPIEFETSELVTLSLFDNFESGSLGSAYSGDTTSFAVVDGSAASDPTPPEGDFALRSDATNGVKTFKTGEHIKRGATFTFRNYLQDDGTSNATVGGNLFAVRDSSLFYRTVLDSGGRHAIELVDSTGTTTLVSSTAPAPENEWIENEVFWHSQEEGTIVSKIVDSNGNVVDKIKVTNETTINSGGFGFQSLGGNDNKYFDHAGHDAVQADARAVEGGPEGNIGANTLIVLPSTVSGVDDVTNPHPMGDSDFDLTNMTQFSVGLPRESDSELRERAQVSEGATSKATIPALIGNLTAIKGMKSVTIFENDTFNDNTGTGGLPEVSFEAVIHGTAKDSDIADTIFETKAATAHDYGGANGTEVTRDVKASNGQVFTMHWSEAAKLDVDMTLDIVVNDSYIGDNPLRDRIVEYIGGVKSDGSSTLGTDTGEDVYVDQVEDVVTGPKDTGVIGISSYSFTPATTADANGLEVVAVGSNETAETNGEDASITLNVTRT